MSEDTPNTPKPSKSKLTKQEAVKLADMKLQHYAEEFTPTKAMVMARSRLQAHMTDHPPLPGTVDLDYIAKFSGSRKIEEWAANPEFIYWILDREYDSHAKKAIEMSMVRVLLDIAEGRSEEIKFSKDGEAYASPTANKDRAKAAEILLNYSDSMPSKKKEIRYLDEGLGRMTETEVDRQIAAARKHILGQAKEPPEE